MALNLLNKLSVERYNGGWTKRVFGIDKNQNNGYSIQGDFVKINEGLNQIKDGLYLDCDINGSRKNQEKDYRLFVIKNNCSEIKILNTILDGGSDWAIRMWDHIEKALDASADDNPLAAFSTADLLAELKRRQK